MAQPTHDQPVVWHTFAAVLAEMPDVYQRLLTEHVPIGTEPALCRRCTAAGTGHPCQPWPCTLAKLATYAEELARRLGQPG